MKMVMVKYNEMKDMTNDVVKHYGNNEAALAYAEEVGEAYEDFLKTKSLMEFKELLINWMMKPNHDISADDARGGD